MLNQQRIPLRKTCDVQSREILVNFPFRVFIFPILADVNSVHHLLLLFFSFFSSAFSTTLKIVRKHSIDRRLLIYSPILSISFFFYTHILFSVEPRKKQKT